jgi:hypothetical protein
MPPRIAHAGERCSMPDGGRGGGGAGGNDTGAGTARVRAAGEPSTSVRGSGPVSSPTPTATATQPPPVVVEQPRVENVAVPDVAGGTVDGARALLAGAGLVLGSITEEGSPAAAGSILRSTPAAASPLLPGAAVDIVVASGFNAVPSVIGLPLDVATAAIQGAGFGVLVVSESDRSASPGTVVRMHPSAGATLLIGEAVTIVVAVTPAMEPAPAATPTPAPSDTEAPPAVP